MPARIHPARRHLRLPLAVAAGAALALGPASSAFAHIDPEPPAVEAGAEATVSFTVEHGCEGSPTTQVDIQVPDGATGISGGESDGFTASVDGQVVSFVGGPLDADTPQAFDVTFTAPDEPGDVPVKIIQICEEGEIDWIEVAAAGEAEPEHPAPILAITEGAPTGEEGGDHHAEEGSDHEETATTEAEGDHHAEEGAATTEGEGDHHAEEGEGAEGADDGDADDEGSSSAPWIIGGVAVLAVAGGGAFFATRSKGAGSGPDAGPDAAA